MNAETPKSSPEAIMAETNAKLLVEVLADAQIVANPDIHTLMVQAAGLTFTINPIGVIPEFPQHAEVDPDPVNWGASKTISKGNVKIPLAFAQITNYQLVDETSDCEEYLRDMLKHFLLAVHRCFYANDGSSLIEGFLASLEKQNKFGVVDVFRTVKICSEAKTHYGATS